MNGTSEWPLLTRLTGNKFSLFIYFFSLELINLTFTCHCQLYLLCPQTSEVKRLFSPTFLLKKTGWKSYFCFVLNLFFFFFEDLYWQSQVTRVSSEVEGPSGTYPICLASLPEGDGQHEGILSLHKWPPHTVGRDWRKKTDRSRLGGGSNEHGNLL